MRLELCACCQQRSQCQHGPSQHLHSHWDQPRHMPAPQASCGSAGRGELCGLDDQTSLRWCVLCLLTGFTSVIQVSTFSLEAMRTVSTRPGTMPAAPMASLAGA